jgi:hypothetical protein
LLLFCQFFSSTVNNKIYLGMTQQCIISPRITLETTLLRSLLSLHILSLIFIFIFYFYFLFLFLIFVLFLFFIWLSSTDPVPFNGGTSQAGVGSVHVTLYDSIGFNVEASIVRYDNADGTIYYSITTLLYYFFPLSLCAYITATSTGPLDGLIPMTITGLSLTSVPATGLCNKPSLNLPFCLIILLDPTTAKWTGAVNGTTTSLLPNAALTTSFYVDSSLSFVAHGLSAILDWATPSGTLVFQNVILTLDSSMVFRSTCPATRILFIFFNFYDSWLQ